MVYVEDFYKEYESYKNELLITKRESVEELSARKKIIERFNNDLTATEKLILERFEEHKGKRMLFINQKLSFIYTLDKYKGV